MGACQELCAEVHAGMYASMHTGVHAEVQAGNNSRKAMPAVCFRGNSGAGAAFSRASIVAGMGALTRGGGRGPAICKATVLLPLSSGRFDSAACDRPHICAPIHPTTATAAVESTSRRW